MLSSSAVFHKGQKSADLDPPQKQILLWFSSRFISSDIEPEVEVALGSTVYNVFHGSLEACDVIVLVTNPAHKHHIFGRIVDERHPQLTVHRPRHNESARVLRQSVVVERPVILVWVLRHCDISLQPMRVRIRPKLINQRIGTITLPSVNANIQYPIHESLEPFFCSWVEEIYESPFTMPPFRSFTFIEEIFFSHAFLILRTLFVNHRSCPLNRKLFTNMTLIFCACMSCISLGRLGNFFLSTTKLLRHCDHIESMLIAPTGIPSNVKPKLLFW